MLNKKKTIVLAVRLAASIAALAVAASAQTPLAWDATKFFQYNVELISFDGSTRTAKVVFSVTNPTTGASSANPAGAPYDIKTDSAFKTPATLRLDIGWTTTEFVNTGSTFGKTYAHGTATYNPTTRITTLSGNGNAAAFPITVNALTSSQACDSSACAGVPNISMRYYITATLPPEATKTGRVAIEGHPITMISVNGSNVVANVPVKSVYANFIISGNVLIPRRATVDINKCKVCHDGNQHGDTVVPRLSMHGANRNEEPGVCVICHNPNQTDIPYRTSGKEESVDLKRMVHGIHAGGFRENALVIIGRNGSVNDFSGVRFPSELRNCLNCHIEINGKGTYELPLAPTVLGSTINTRSLMVTASNAGGYVDVNPLNDVKITPIASVCSSCHDKQEVKDHMISKGASFSNTYNFSASAWPNNERCPSCHGPGQIRDIKSVHGIGGYSDSHD